MLTVKAVIKAAVLALAVTVPVATATAGAAHATEGTSTMAYSFAEGLGGGQKVAWAEDGVPMRSVENLNILVAEFRSNFGGVPLPVSVKGVADADRDGLDDDGRVSVAMFSANACLKLGARSFAVVDGGCGTVAPVAVSSTKASARGVAAATRWNVASENAWAAQGLGVRQAAWSVQAIRAALTEVRPGVTVRGLADRNRNGIDDDGKLTFTSATGSVCLQLSRTGGAPVLTSGAC